MSAGTLKKIDARMEKLEPESTRFRVLAALRRFRSSWVELGQLLTEVAYGGDFKEWGYEDFDTYCARELGLKKPTVKKLMLSYRYMQKNEPRRLEAWEEWDGKGAPPDVPDYQTVELLHRARENDEIGEEDKDRFHRLAFEDGAEQTALRKEIRDAMRPEDEEGSDRERELQDLRRTSRVLRRKLADSRHVPGGLRERFERLLAELEALE